MIDLTYKQIRAIKPLKDWLDVKYNKIYILSDNFGSIYRDGTSIGYFTYGSAITFVKNDSAEYIIAKINGKEFKVTQDSSFGNTPSKFHFLEKQEIGEIPLSVFPRIIEHKDYLQALKRIN